MYMYMYMYKCCDVIKLNTKRTPTFIMIFRSCLISESVTVLLIQPNTMMARGCRAGLYWNANLQETKSLCELPSFFT